MSTWMRTRQRNKTKQEWKRGNRAKTNALVRRRSMSTDGKPVRRYLGRLHVEWRFGAGLANGPLQRERKVLGA